MNKKTEWFKQEKKDFFKAKTKVSTPKPKKNDDFTPERALKLAAGVAVVSVGLHVATDLLTD